MNGMTLIVKTITRLILGFIIVFAVSIVFYGHITPGGGFAGGVMLACVFILLVLAFGKDTAFRIIGEKALSAWDCIGALGFMGIALFGFTQGVFFKNFLTSGEPLRLISGGTIMWSNIAIGIKVSAGLFAVFVALALFRINRER
ncbi:MAG: MnhB domain-containing protein [Candidatus Latescibacter sp.]|nr:MnhB domain-containing protein [Candidatus Latescibacter sp.]